MSATIRLEIQQGADFSRVLTYASGAVEIADVTNTTNPTVTTREPHGLSVGSRALLYGVAGASAINGTLQVATVPTPLSFTVTAPAPGAYLASGKVGKIVDLTGYTARMQIRDYATGALLMELTTEDGRLALGGVLGTIEIRLTAEETTALSWTYGQYDLELVSAGGLVRRPFAGDVFVSREVTR